MPSSAHHVADLLAQRRVALPGAVLQCLRAARARPGRPNVSPTTSSGSAGEVRHPAGERDDLGRLATANRARISEAVMLRVRSAYESTNGSSRTRRPVPGVVRVVGPVGWHGTSVLQGRPGAGRQEPRRAR